MLVAILTFENANFAADMIIRIICISTKVAHPTIIELAKPRMNWRGIIVIEVDVEQGSSEWEECRLSIPTASNFHRIVTPSGKLSAQAEGYCCELLAEFFLNQQVSEFAGTFFTERGRVLEPEARKFYAFIRDTTPRLAGFCYKDESKLVGASPDWLLDPDGGAEVKCPDAGQHLMYLAQGVVPKAYMPQVQGQIWVTGRTAWEFMSYYPGLPPLLVRVEPDEKYQAALDKYVPVFIEEMLERREQLRAKGLTPIKELWASESNSSSVAAAT